MSLYTPSEPDEWEGRMSTVWARASDLDDDVVLAAVDALVAQLPETDARGPFEAAGARDYLGLEAQAAPLYRRAIELGLTGDRVPRVTIQLASTLRNLGEVDEAIALLEARLHEHPDDEWAAPTAAFLSLCLATKGEERRAAATALTALAGLVPAYGRAIRSYAAEL